MDVDLMMAHVMMDSYGAGEKRTSYKLENSNEKKDKIGQNSTISILQGPCHSFKILQWDSVLNFAIYVSITWHLKSASGYK